MSENKAVIPRKVAEAIENMRKRWEDKALVQFENYESPTIDSYPELRIIKNYFGLPHSSDNFTELMRALVNGYEVERTPCDKLVEFYKSWCGKDLEWHEGVKTGIEGTLKILSEQYPELRKLLNELTENERSCRV